MSEWISGLVGGCAGVLVGHPFDTVKVKLQTQNARNPIYKGTWDGLSKTYTKEGVKGLYKGMAPPMAGVGVVNAIVFGVQGSIARLFRDPNALSSQFVSGASAGLVQSFVISPVELAKTRLQIQADALAAGKISSLKYKGSIDCLKSIFNSEGIRGLFRGQTITIAREVPALGTYFLSFAAAERFLRGSQEHSPLATFMAGGLAGIASWTVCYPVDVIKTRLQSDGAFGKEQYRGILDCYRQSVKSEGMGVLSKGLSTTVIRAFPANAATFLTVSYCTRFLESISNDDDSINMETFKEIVSVGDPVIQAASVGLELMERNRLRIERFQMDPLSSLLPIIQDTLRETDCYKYNLSNVATSFYENYCKKFTVVTINEISQSLWV